MESLKPAVDVLFVLMGAVMVLAMHAGFAFLEVGSVRRKNQVNALVKILTDFAVSTIAYFFIGYGIAYGMTFLVDAKILAGKVPGAGFAPQGYDLVKFFFLATFCAAVPAIVSGGIAERAKFWPQLTATALITALFYPSFEGLVWGTRLGLQDSWKAIFGEAFHDFAGSVVVHAFGGWLALGAVLMLGARRGRYRRNRVVAIPPSNIPFLALGSWILVVGWFGFNVMSAQTADASSGLVALNSLMALVGGILGALVVGRNDPGFVHNGALAGLVAICAGSDIVHPVGGLVIGVVAGGLFVWAFEFCQNRLRIDDVLGVWPLHGLCGLMGGIAAGVFGQQALGGLGGVSFAGQLAGSAAGAALALAVGLLVYGGLKAIVGIRLSEADEFRGADLSIHHIPAYPEEVSSYPHDDSEEEESAAPAGAQPAHALR